MPIGDIIRGAQAAASGMFGGANGPQQFNMNFSFGGNGPQDSSAFFNRRNNGGNGVGMEMPPGFEGLNGLAGLGGLAAGLGALGGHFGTSQNPNARINEVIGNLMRGFQDLFTGHQFLRMTNMF